MIHIFHKWGKWEEVEKGDVVNGSYSDRPGLKIGRWMIMKRTCDTCGMVQYKKISSL